MITIMNISMIVFAEPLWLIAILPIPLFIYIADRRLKEKYPAIRIADLSVAERSVNKRRVIWPVITRMILYFVMFLLVIAMARPQMVLKNSESNTEGIDIIITMDISLSMLARDFEPNRLDASKDVASRFIKDRGPDRIGIVIFSGQSFTLCPLTADKAALITLLQQAQAGFIEDGSTAIGDGIATAINRLKDSEARSKVIILLTDGENNAGNIDPLQAAEIASMYGIRLYTIGVGSRGTALGPVQIIGGNIIYGPVEVDIDEPALKKAASIADGKYFRAVDENALYDVYKEIDKLEKSRLKVTEHHARIDLFAWTLLPAFLLIFAAWLIRYLFVKMIP